MATVQILTDGNPTPSLNHTLEQPVTFTNVDNTPGITYLWELVEDPAWTPELAAITTATTNPAAASFTITPMKRGTYLVRLTLNPGTPGQVVGTTVLGVRHDNIRIPAVRETTESGVDGWGPPMQDALAQLDNMLTNGIEGITTAAGLDIGSLGELGGLGESPALSRSDHRHGTTPQDPGTPMGSDLSAWKLYSTDTIIQQKLLTQGIVLVAETTDLSASDPNCYIVLANTAVAGFTLTLPSAAGTLEETNLGRQLRIKNIGGNTLTVAHIVGDTIDGGVGSGTLPPGSAVDLVSDGASWWVLGFFGPP